MARFGLIDMVAYALIYTPANASAVSDSKQPVQPCVTKTIARPFGYATPLDRP